jgi:hypothetical protein
MAVPAERAAGSTVIAVIRMSLRPRVLIWIPALSARTLDAVVPLESGVMWTPDGSAGGASRTTIPHRPGRGAAEGDEAR